ncbi:hypothetical protein WMY93_011556 [Mugilogobius chulae]|uniref:Uncharacterized protein n=1 Tax=Mugilogobius chulae TaxID=88201 RepID=A0AAW0P4C4_9GOBI
MRLLPRESKGWNKNQNTTLSMLLTGMSILDCEVFDFKLTEKKEEVNPVYQVKYGQISQLLHKLCKLNPEILLQNQVLNEYSKENPLS